MSIGSEDRATVESLLEGGAPDASVVVIARIVRRVLRVTLPSGLEVYAKQHTFPFTRLRLRYALRPSPTRHEARMLECARGRGLVVPEVVAERTERGWVGPTRAVIVTAALPESAALGPEDRLDAVEELASKGVFHPDLQPDNVLKVGGRFAFLDFQSCRLERAPLGRRDVQRMFAKTVHHLRAETGDEALRGLVAARIGAVRAQAVFARAERYRAGVRESARRHRLRSSTRIESRKLGRAGRRLIVRGETLPAAFDDEIPFEHRVTGVCRMASSRTDDTIRLSRRGRLRSLWAHAAGDAVLERAFLAHDRDGPWPWARQCLYIRGPMGGLDLQALLTRLSPALGARL